MQRRPTVSFVNVVTILSFSLLTLAWTGCLDPFANRPEEQGVDAVGPGSSFSQIYFDPVTGRVRQPSLDQVLRPTREEHQVQAPALRAAAPRGGVYYRTDPSQMHFQFATATDDGGLQTECLTGQEATARHAGERRS